MSKIASHFRCSFWQKKRARRGASKRSCSAILPPLRIGNFVRFFDVASARFKMQPESKRVEGWRLSGNGIACSAASGFTGPAQLPIGLSRYILYGYTKHTTGRPSLGGR